MGSPQVPDDLTQHECLRLKTLDEPLQPWRMWTAQNPEHVVEVSVKPVLSGNHTDTLLRATLDAAGITSVSINIVAPYLMAGKLVRVFSPWFTGRLALYAALPSRKFIPQRTEVHIIVADGRGA